MSGAIAGSVVWSAVMTMKVRVTRVGPAEQLAFDEMIAVLRSGLRGVETLVDDEDLRRWSGAVARMEQVGERDTPMGCREHRVQGARLLREMHAAVCVRRHSDVG